MTNAVAKPGQTLKLTGKQKRLVAMIVDHGLRGEKAALAAGYSKSGAAVVAYRELRKPHIQAEIDKRLRERMQQEAPVAFQRVVDLAGSARSERVSLEAAQDILNRAGYAPQPAALTYAPISIHIDLGEDDTPVLVNP